jgi:hypothetical protein
LRGVSLQHYARIILNVTWHLLNSLGLIRLQLLSLIAAWPMPQPWPTLRANERPLRSYLQASAERLALKTLKAQRRDAFEWSCPWRPYPCSIF